MPSYGSPVCRPTFSSSVRSFEAPKDVKVGYYVDGKRTDIAVKPNDKTLAYDGALTAPSSATFIVTGARLPQIWATTPEGLNR